MTGVAGESNRGNEWEMKQMPHLHRSSYALSAQIAIEKCITKKANNDY